MMPQKPDLRTQPQSGLVPKDGRIVIGIPTAGRSGILAQTVRFLSHQDRLPDLVLISVGDRADAAGIEDLDLPFPVEVVLGPKGLSVQRNAILNRLTPNDLLLFLDDDFLMAPDYLTQLAQIFSDHPDIVMTTGTVIADGILGMGLSFEQGETRLADGILKAPERKLHPVANGYGCNMAVRASAFLNPDIRFDEKLPLYSWLEDVDFSARLRSRGRIVQASATRGVHLGTKTGRTPGLNLGYSQIANPVYLLGKGTMPRARVLGLIVRHLGSNLLGTLRPRPWADYRGRLVGNLRAIWDLCLGTCDPQNILRFTATRTYDNGRWRKIAPR